MKKYHLFYVNDTETIGFDYKIAHKTDLFYIINGKQKKFSNDYRWLKVNHEIAVITTSYEKGYVRASTMGHHNEVLTKYINRISPCDKYIIFYPSFVFCATSYTEKEFHNIIKNKWTDSNLF